MEFLTNTNFKFLKYRHFFIWFSIVLNIVAIVEIFALGGLNLGIDFKGGYQLTVKTREAVAVGDLRNNLAAAGLRDAQIQQLGDAQDHEVLIKLPLPEGAAAGSAQEAAGQSQIIQALETALNKNQVGAKLDLNQRGLDSIAEALKATDPDGKGRGDEAAAAHYQAIATAVVKQRDDNKMFGSWDEVAATPGLSAAALESLKNQGAIGSYRITSNEKVGSQIGAELRQKGIWAVVLSLLAMLIYIWFRFELRFGIGALIASLHDVLIVLGLFALFNFEFNLSTIAAFLTLVGYSVNDTVVVFDRVRENMRRFRRLGLEEQMDRSINETLPRTIMTSGTTLLACMALFFFGGEVLRGFSFVMMIGVLVGTYSSVFIASPFALWWDEWTRNRAAQNAGEKAAPAAG
jgi:preprotein translocase subunit SecF